jgi:hypothetical protein
VFRFRETGYLAAGMRSFVQTQPRILIALAGDRIDASHLASALQTCRRINKSVDILVAPPSLSTPLMDFFDQLRAAGLRHRLILKNGQLGEEIIRHVNSNRDICMVLIDSLDNWPRRFGGAEPWRSLSCPFGELSD